MHLVLSLSFVEIDLHRLWPPNTEAIGLGNHIYRNLKHAMLLEADIHRKCPRTVEELLQKLKP
jgi:hypothetical protein